jgi:ATP-dependent DNA helicase DinG
MKIQGDASKQALLTAHREAVDAGKQSVLVGLASFAEGVDLPDDYCRHVVIAKLPFAVPDDPVDQAMAEWAEAQGRNAFFDIAVPDAALRLVQACGRLIRHERDYGRITLLDRRVITRRYGQRLLDSLPPFRRELDVSL